MRFKFITYFFLFHISLWGLSLRATDFDDLFIIDKSNSFFSFRNIQGQFGKKKIQNLKPQKILFLGDMEDAIEGHISLASIYGEYFKGTDVVIYKSDYQCKNTDFLPDKNYKEFYIDHTRPLPYADNEIDIIIGLRVLCQCIDLSVTCGGLDIEIPDQFNNFFNEIARVLNKNNPNSFAFIHGSEPGQSKYIKRELRGMFMESIRSNNLLKDAIQNIPNGHGNFNYMRLVHTLLTNEYTGEKFFHREGVVMGNANLTLRED